MTLRDQRYEDKEEGVVLTTYPMGWRHVVTFIGFVGFFVIYTLRVNLSVAMVAMVNQTAVNLMKEHASNDNKTYSSSSICAITKNDTDYNSTDYSAKKIKEGTFNWDSEIEGVVLASFFYGYIVTQIPGGWLAGRYGAKWVFGLGTVWTAALTLLSPPAAELGVGMLIAVRVLEGLGEGVTWPAMQSLFSRWAPPSERSKLPAFAYAGCFVGTPITFLLSGIMIESGFLGGWPSVFYVFGILGCVWFIFWVFLVSSSPEDHKWISRGEQTYIVKSLEQEQAGGKVKPGFSDVPWKEIVKSPAVWAVVIAHFSYNWSLYVLLTGLPKYFKSVLGFDIKTNGAVSALPYICQSIVHASSGQLADQLRTRFQLQTVTVRKLFDCLGHLLPAIFIISVGYVGCNSDAAVALLVLCVGFSGLCGAGFFVNFLDIAPQYAGILFGISNGFATIPGIIGPYITGLLTKSATIESWRAVFFIAGVIYLVSVVVFAIFARGTIQPWAQPKKSIVEPNETTNM